MSRKILVLDTTLRDGEQVPGAKLNLTEKLEVARQLIRLNVDIIEAGFPASSPGDARAVAEIARVAGKDAMVTALARAVRRDIDAVWESIRHAEHPLIHMVLGASDVHVEKKFSRSKDEVLAMGVEAVRYAKTLCPWVQYSTEDASRADFEYLWKTIEAVIRAGATIVNVPDTVGFAVPEEFGQLIARLNDRIKNLNPDVLLSVHCHNDTGMATANTLAAVRNGADKVEVTINGIGERAGNAALEEVVMAMKLRQSYYGAHTDICTREIKRTSQLVSGMMGLDVQVNKAITGDNAFAHSSGIHQDGLLKSRDAYEVIHPEDVGVETMELILTARSGRHAVRHELTRLGYAGMGESTFETVFAAFLDLADRKKEVTPQDLMALAAQFGVDGGISSSDQYFTLDSLHVVSHDRIPSASVAVRRGAETFRAAGIGNGPVDAMISALSQATGCAAELVDYRISSVSRGTEAQGRVTVRLQQDGQMVTARGTDTDILRATALAYLDGVNKMIFAAEKVCV